MDNVINYKEVLMEIGDELEFFEGSEEEPPAKLHEMGVGLMSWLMYEIEQDDKEIGDGLDG